MIVRLNLLKTTNLHTILRLPTGIFSAENVKTHVLFFDNKPLSKTPWTQAVWFYDYRTNIQHSFRKNPIQSDCLAEFIGCYHSKNRDPKINRKEIETFIHQVLSLLYDARSVLHA